MPISSRKKYIGAIDLIVFLVTLTDYLANTTKPHYMSKMKYTLKEVTDKTLEKEFIELPKRLYKGNRNWVCPLDDDIKAVFDPAKNKLFADGEAIRWVAYNQEGEVVGRIAAFYDNEHAYAYEQPTGGCGFFEAINDQELANQLFDSARMWLLSRGMEAMDGPINFGPRDSWWGLLVEGYEFQPLYSNPYNPPYYKELFENYGFQNYFNQNTYLWRVYDDDINKSIHDRAERLRSTPGYSFANINGRDLEEVAVLGGKARALLGDEDVEDHALGLFLKFLDRHDVLLTWRCAP